MELSVETMKQAITDNPGITNPELEEIFNKDCHAIGRCRVKLKNTREVDGKESWLFRQMDCGLHRNFSRTYAKKHNIRKMIPAPKKQGDTNKSGEETATGDDSIRMAKMWAAPKRLLT